MPHMPHIQKLAYIRTYAAYFRICDRIFLVQPCIKTVKYFLVINDYRHLQSDVK